ncbi:MAG: DUF4412 domain-containing protein [Syntrophobacteraceae bacterium]|jgi:outer membrane lipoprotein-sorting protein|nr:DUF4412 domain-containing protein [Syntrophobacteraceae bacterium]
MKTRSCKPFVLFLAVVTAVTLTAFGFSMAADFSADFSVKTTGEDEVKGKIFVKGNKIRQEVTEEGDTQILIIRPDKNVTWMITPDEKMYMEIPYESESQSVEPWSAEKEKGAKYLGEETVNGHPAKKYETVEEGEKVSYWISKKLNFPVKIQDSESVMEYRNIKEGSVADSQFDVPSGYEKMTMPVMPGAKGSSNQ